MPSKLYNNSIGAYTRKKIPMEQKPEPRDPGKQNENTDERKKRLSEPGAHQIPLKRPMSEASSFNWWWTMPSELYNNTEAHARKGCSHAQA